MPRTDADLWKVYANKVKEFALQGQDVGPNNRLYIPPLNACAILAGPKVDSSVTNFGIAKAGDGLITLDNPLFDSTSGETFAKRCLQYLQQVQLESQGDIANLQVRDERQAAADRSADKLQEVKAKAKKFYKDEGGAETGMNFEDWAQKNYKPYANAKKQADADASAFNSIMVKIYGPGYEALQTALTRLEGATSDEPSKFNMPVSSFLPQYGSTETATVTGYAPKYSIDPGYALSVQNWIAKTADPNPPKTTISISSEEVDQYDWKSVGHDDSKVHADASFAPFFTINYDYNNRTEKSEVNINDSNTKVTVEIHAMGIKTFSIKADSDWAPGNFKEKYPNLAKGAPAELWAPMVQVTNVVVGYNVGLTIKFDKSTFEKIEEDINKAKSHSGGFSGSIFGVQFGASGSTEDQLKTDLKKVKFNPDNFSIEVPASNDTVPVLIAAVGQVIGKV